MSNLSKNTHPLSNAIHINVWYFYSSIDIITYKLSNSQSAGKVTGKEEINGKNYTFSDCDKESVTKSMYLLLQKQPLITLSCLLQFSKAQALEKALQRPQVFHSLYTENLENKISHRNALIKTCFLSGFARDLSQPSQWGGEAGSQTEALIKPATVIKIC